MPFSQKKIELSPRLKSGIGRGHSQNQILKYAAFLCLILAAVLTFDAAKLILTSKSQAPSASSQVLGASDVKEPANNNTVQFTNYTVQKSDTLFDISQKYNISWTTLATINNLKAPFSLKPGQVLKVPKQ